MGDEASKLRRRWMREGLWSKYFAIPGIKVLDIGCGGDKIIESADGYDKEQGDGQVLKDVADESYDVVFSSHFIEHLRDPIEGLLNQWRVLKSGGYLIFQVPDEDLYEQGVWPSRFNDDHKYTYTINKSFTWSPGGKNVTDLLKYLPSHKVISMRIIDTDYDYTEQRIVDQTASIAEAAVEVIVQKFKLQCGWQSKLETIFMCPNCGHMEFVIRGVDSEGQYDAWCRNCGVAGKLRRTDAKNVG